LADQEMRCWSLPLVLSALLHLEARIVCEDTCSYTSDNACDDGGAGAEYTACSFGSDCKDCGSRDDCLDSCSEASDGYCDDGGQGAEYTSCAAGTDCTDCGDGDRSYAGRGGSGGGFYFPVYMMPIYIMIAVTCVIMRLKRRRQRLHHDTMAMHRQTEMMANAHQFRGSRPADIPMAVAVPVAQGVTAAGPAVTATTVTTVTASVATVVGDVNGPVAVVEAVPVNPTMGSAASGVPVGRAFPAQAV